MDEQLIYSHDCDLIADEKVANCVLCYRYDICKGYFEKNTREIDTVQNT